MGYSLRSLEAAGGSSSCGLCPPGLDGRCQTNHSMSPVLDASALRTSWALSELPTSTTVYETAVCR